MAVLNCTKKENKTYLSSVNGLADTNDQRSTVSEAYRRSAFEYVVGWQRKASSTTKSFQNSRDDDEDQLSTPIRTDRRTFSDDDRRNDVVRSTSVDSMIDHFSQSSKLR
jgi:hypothetical protein